MSSGEVVVKVVPLRGFVLDFDIPHVGHIEASLVVEVERNGKKVKIGVERVTLFKKYFRNKFSAINRKFYKKVHEICVKTPIGWLIPIQNLDKLRKIEQEIRKEWEIFDKELREFIQFGKLPQHLIETIRKRYGEEGFQNYIREISEYREIVNEYLRQKGVTWDEFVKKIPYLPSKFRIKMLPFNISLDEVLEIIPEEVKPYVESKVQETMENIKKEIINGFVQELEKTKEEIRNVLNEVKKEIINKRVSEAVKKLREIENKVILIDPSLRTKIVELRREVSRISSNPSSENVLTTCKRFETLIQWIANIGKELK